MNARITAGTDLYAGDVGKPGPKLNILGVEITPDDSKLRGATNRTGISGKTMLEQLSHLAGIVPVGGEGTTGGSEEDHGPENNSSSATGQDYREGGKDSAANADNVGRSSWNDKIEDPALGRAAEAAGDTGIDEE